VLVAAGDIACAPGVATTPSQCQQAATAAVVESLDPEVVAALGDLQYERGQRAGFDAAYGPTWGRFRDRTRPVPGNHEYAGGKANGYFGYWGEAAHAPGGWYSYDVGAWHVVALNSVCAVVGCGEGSEQLAWLRQDLADHPVRCTLAYWHHPRWSSGLHGPDTSVAPLWDALAAAGADVVLSGHDHHYERFAPVDGVRQFVVGTGGRNLYPVLGRDPGSERVDTSTFGVLALTLRPDGYDWRFVPIAGSTFTDAGSAGCG
jgi:3',5'-cyclic AMP phosphodiesterase CpdA